MQAIEPISDQQSKVIKTASKLFIEQGVRTVTMDEIATVLGMSKKTLYLLFRNKADIVFHSVQIELAQKRQEILQITSLDYEPIREMLELGKLNAQTFKSFSAGSLDDLRRFYPEAWRLVDNFKEDEIYKQLLCNLKRGIQSGDYRDNLNPDILSHIYISLLDSVIMQHSFLKTGISLDTVYKENLLMHIYSICSDQGRNKLETLLKTEDFS